MTYLGKIGKFSSIENILFLIMCSGYANMLSYSLYLYTLYCLYIYYSHSFLSVEYFIIKSLFNKKDSILLHYPLPACAFL